MTEKLEELDRTIFLLVNSAHSPFMDEVMHTVSMRTVWIPVYLLALYFVYRIYNWKGILAVAAGAGIMIFLSDFGSVHLFKNMFERYRPCNNLLLNGSVHIYENECSTSFSFISSHASNFFAVATLLTLIFKNHFRFGWILFFSCAALVAYSRVYLGLHYPSDVFIGGLYGILCGLAGFFIFRFVKNKLNSAA